ncbi:hypothetical protein K0M31_016891 [Melipona bicolor]|uniref:Uncharacterized protein n=1 Tax=Melipona bicolor TaxID=60889 RepID=A0AA40KEB2_9HYME|nr:hypothetical protein K0M31_016891 [Melipona bicolor]
MIAEDVPIHAALPPNANERRRSAARTHATPPPNADRIEGRLGQLGCMLQRQTHASACRHYVGVRKSIHPCNTQLPRSAATTCREHHLRKQRHEASNIDPGPG